MKRARNKRRVKLKSVRSLRRKLDQVFSKWIRGRDAPHNGIGPCYTCGKQRRLEASHFIPRQHTRTRWNEMNVHGCCAYCNRWLHGNLYEYGRRLAQDYGQATVDSLVAQGRIIWKPSRADLEALIARYS